VAWARSMVENACLIVLYIGSILRLLGECLKVELRNDTALHWVIIRYYVHSITQ